MREIISNFFRTQFSIRSVLANILWTVIGTILIWSYSQWKDNEPWIKWTIIGLIVLTAVRFISMLTASDRRPDLKLQLIEITVGAIHGPNGSRHIGLIFTLSVRNTGAPSIADGWNLNFWLGDSKSPVRCDKIDFPEELVLPSGDPAVPGRRFLRKDALYAKTETFPIPTGGKVVGHLYFGIANMDVANLTIGSRFVLTGRDIQGRQFKLEDRTTRPQPHIPAHIPGTTP